MGTFRSMQQFRHAAEQELAAILDELGIAWEYGAHTFVLDAAGDGAPCDTFTPSFFCPTRISTSSAPPACGRRAPAVAGFASCAAAARS